MPECKVAILCRYNLSPAEMFAEVLSDYDAGTPKVTVKQRGRLIKDETPYTRYTRTVVTPGIRIGAWVGNKYHEEPPKYPPAKIDRCAFVDFDKMAEIAADTRVVILAVDDTGDGIPVGFEDMGWEEPMAVGTDSTHAIMRNKLVYWARALVGDDEADQTKEMLNNYRDDHEGFTPRMLFGRLRRFVS